MTSDQLMALIDGLQDPSTDVRYESAYQFSKRGREARMAVPSVLKAVEDADGVGRLGGGGVRVELRRGGALVAGRLVGVRQPDARAGRRLAPFQGALQERHRVGGGPAGEQVLGARDEAVRVHDARGALLQEAREELHHAEAVAVAAPAVLSVTLKV